MKVSVVIPVHNDPRIRKCLASILGQDHPDYEVIVVDDGSTDGTPQVIAEFQGVRVLRKEKGGAASARNDGAALAQGEIVLFLDSDTVVDSDFVSKMAAPFERNPRIGMTHAIYGIENEDSFIARLIYEKCDYIFRNLDEMDFAWSFGIAIRREVFRSIGMFDHQFPGAGSEDTDLAYRLCDGGHTIKLVREAVVRHHFHETLERHLKRHINQAKLRMMLIRKATRFTDQQARPSQYVSVVAHAAFWVSLPLSPWAPWLPAVLLVVAMSFHLDLARWAVRKNKDWRYLAFLPFEFATISAWVVGCLQGSWWMARRRIGTKC